MLQHLRLLLLDRLLLLRLLLLRLLLALGLLLLKPIARHLSTTETFGLGPHALRAATTSGLTSTSGDGELLRRLVVRALQSERGVLLDLLPDLHAFLGDLAVELGQLGLGLVDLSLALRLLAAGRSSPDRVATNGGGSTNRALAHGRTSAHRPGLPSTAAGGSDAGT